MGKKDKEPRPEFNRPYDDCPICGDAYYLNEQNAALYTYEDFPEANHILTLSDCCEAYTRIFLAEDSESYPILRYFRIPEVRTKVPNDYTMEAYIQIFDIPVVKEKEITPRQQTKVDFLGYLLDKGMIDPNSFNDDVNL